jgi:cytochrome b
MPPSNTRRVPIWDLPTRLFHWLLVLLFAVSYLSAQRGEFAIHFASGYAMLTILLFRIAWGFTGSRSARFTDFVKGPGAALRYLRGWFASKHDDVPTLGHNPAGGLMVLAMLVFLLVQAVSGLFTTDEVLNDGPFVRHAASEVVGSLSIVHRMAIDVLLILIAIHVAAVFAYAIVRREDLVAPMITGRKKVPEGVAGPVMSSPALAFTILAICAAMVAGLIGWTTA